MKMTEQRLHKQVSDYIKHQYPKVIFNSDMAGSVKLTIGQAKKIADLRSSRGFPDIAIYEPRANYCGLLIELKTLQNNPFKKDGQLKKDQHLQEQHDMIERLNEKGYKACFGVGFDNTKKIIDHYMKKNINEKLSKKIVLWRKKI